MMTNDAAYLSAWIQISVFLVGGLLFVGLALLVSTFLRPNHPNIEKMSAYESGEEAQGEAWIQFNISFYVMALIFLLFEVEVIFLFPWSIVFAKPELQNQTHGLWGWYTFSEMLIFILVLALGLLYVWKKGHLDWIKPNPVPSDFISPVPAAHYEAINKKYKTNHGT